MEEVNFKGLKANRFLVELPKEFDIPSFLLYGVGFDCPGKNEISFELKETTFKNIRKDFSNFKYKSDTDCIKIHYLDETGCILRTDKFTGLNFEGVFDKCVDLYYSSDKPITTMIYFKYNKKEYLDGSAD